MTKPFLRVVYGVVHQVINAQGEVLRQGFLETERVEHRELPYGFEKFKYPAQELPNGGNGPTPVVMQVTSPICEGPLEWNDLWGVVELNFRVDPINTAWTRTTEEMFYNMLGAVPPVRQGYNSFLAGEASGHIVNEPFYHCFMQNADTDEYFVRNMTAKQYDKLFVQRRRVNPKTLQLEPIE